MVLLVSSDNEQFIVDRDTAECSGMIKATLDLIGECDKPIPLYNVSSGVLKKASIVHFTILEYCEHYKGDPLLFTDPESQDESRRRCTDISEWDQIFILVDQEMLFEIFLAANYLDIKPLLKLCSKTVANMVKGKTPEEIRKIFGVVNDFTPEEEAQIRKENEWKEDKE